MELTRGELVAVLGATSGAYIKARDDMKTINDDWWRTIHREHIEVLASAMSKLADELEHHND